MDENSASPQTSRVHSRADGSITTAASFLVDRIVQSAQVLSSSTTKPRKVVLPYSWYSTPEIVTV